MDKCTFLESFNYCPKCGGGFIDNNIKSKKCVKCGFVFYFNPSAAVVAIIKNSQGQILVARRAKEPAKGSLDLPGGFVDSYESSEEAVAREVAEESGLKVIKTKYLFSLPNIYRYSDFDVHTLDLFYECTVEKHNDAEAKDDVAELMWLSPQDIKPSLFGLKSVSQGISRYLSEP